MDAIYTVVAIVVILGLGWLATKSKVLNGILNAFGLASNILWGSLFIAGGVLGLFGGYGIWIPLLSIGIGIYYFTTSRFDAKVSAAVEGAVETVADLAAEKLAGREDADAAAPEATPEPDPSGEALPPAAKPLALYHLLLVVAVVGVSYGLWALRDVGEVTMTFYGDGSVDTQSSDGSPLGWIALLGGGAAIPLWRAFRRREQSGQPIAMASLNDVLTSVSKVDTITKKRLTMVLAAIALVVVGVVGTNAARSAWSRHLEGQYAEREAAGIAQAEAEAAANEDEPEPDPDLTPNGNSRWLQPADLLGMAPEDGSTCHALATWTAAGGDAGSFLLEIDDISLGGSDAEHIWDVELFQGELGSCYIDDMLVSEDELSDFIGSPSASAGLGSIEFTNEEIVSARAYSDAYVPADGY